MKNILITGGFGFTGSHLINKLDEMNYDLIIYSKRNTDSRIIKNKKNLIFEKGDIIDSTRISEVVEKYDPKIIVHLAALTGITKCQNDPQGSFLTNVYGTFNIANACINSKTHLIFLSSREVYGETKNDRTSENDPKTPNNVYGITKLQAENLILWANEKYGLNFTILRPTNIYGYGGDKYGAQILIKKILANSSIQVYGGKQKMNFVHVEDVVDAITKAMIDNRSHKETLNVGSNDTLTILEFVDLLSKLTDKKPHLEFLPMREGETNNFNVSINKIKDVLNWKPSTNIESGLSSTIDWYKNNP